jgi:hypothetical protein
MRVGCQCHAPVSLPSARTRYPLYRRLSGPQGRSGRVEKISPPQGFHPRTLQAVANRYTDCAIPAHIPLGDQVYSHFHDCPVAVQVSSDPYTEPFPNQIHPRLPFTNYTQFPTPLRPRNFHVFTQLRFEDRLRCQ